MSKDKTTYTVPEDNPQMASEPVVAYDNWTPPCPCQFTDEELDEEIRLAEEEGFMSVEETKNFLLRQRLKMAYKKVMQKEFYTLEEAYELTAAEIKAVYEGKYGV